MKKFLFVMFITIPLVISSAIFLTPDREASDNENRSLKTREAISLGSFQSDFEEYLSDQLFMRDEIVSAKNKLLYLSGKRDINGCYICSDRFVQKITDSDIDVKSIEKYCEKINKLAEDIDTCVMLIPSAGVALPSCLPKNAAMYNYEELYADISERLSNAQVLDIKSKLCDDGDYYLTDHHWTADGSYKAYIEWCRAVGVEPENYSFEIVTGDFRGTLYSKALIKNNIRDYIKIPVIERNITVTADGQSINLYEKAALNSKDKYNYFQGGNHGVVVIENKDSDNSDVLLILKDSFANSFVPYLISHYHKIIMLDERYSFDSPSEIIQSENVTDLLVLKEIVS